MKTLTDKAARDPAIFIRNLLRKEPPTKTLPYCFGRGMSFTPSFPQATIIDGEVVEIISEVPVPVERAQRRNVSQLSRTMNPIYRETVPPTPSAGRIVNVDPRYPEF